MIRVTTIFKRPNTSIPYYIETDPVLRDEKEEFAVNCGLIYKFTKDEEDPLVQKIIVDFVSKEVLNKFLYEWNKRFPTLINDRDRYCKKHGIIIERVEEEINL